MRYCLMVFLFLFPLQIVGQDLKQDLLLHKNGVFYVKQNYDLGNDTISISDGCILRFDGGRISNGVITSNGLFPIEAGLSQIFHNIKFVIKSGGTMKVNAEWFGVDRRHKDVENSHNLQRLLASCRNLHVQFQDGIYRFSSRHPVYAKGRYVLTGECSASFSEIPRTCLLITGNPDKPSFFLTIETDRSTLKYLTIQSSGGKDLTKWRNIGGVFLKDGINPGNLDSAVEACMFYNLKCPLKAFGRCFSMINCRVQESGGIIIKQTKTNGSNYTQQPPYDGRGLFLDNIRVHWIKYDKYDSCEYNSFGAKKMAFLTVLHNDMVSNSTMFGVMINNIYADGSCRLLDCDSEANGFIITNVFCPNPGNEFVRFRRDVSDIIFSKLIVKDHYKKLGEDHIKVMFAFDSDMSNCTITDNIFGNVDDDLIVVRGEKPHKMDKCIITNNIIKGGRSILGVENTDVSMLYLRNNIIGHNDRFSSNVYVIGNHALTKIIDSVIE